DAATLQRFGRLARYWELLANSGRFAQTLPLLLHTPPSNGTAGKSPFWCFMVFSNWLWQRQGSTHRLTPEALVDALFDYLGQHLPPAVVRQALLADYVASGARANPQALHGLLPRRAASPARASRTLATRQERHRVPAPLPLPS
ncbi:MAG: B12-binding domain-containing radical SAM protein, partial [Rhodoferax sp.]|nr:B12-binding domain-containing radical SAM protein [Rhodoferax sp.]